MSERRQLEFFVAVYRTRSFRLASEQLGQSQSTLTKTIQRLEERLDLRLFNRTTPLGRANRRRTSIIEFG